MGFSLDFLDIHRHTHHQVDAIGEGTVEVVILGLVVEEIVNGCSHLECLAELLDSREFPKRVGGVVYGAGPFGDVVVVDELHVLYIGKETPVE
jgi:hypothetical protein